MLGGGAEGTAVPLRTEEREARKGVQVRGRGGEGQEGEK